jgi:hypothetical protein
MTYHIGDVVRIKDTAFAGSGDPQDAAYRGQTGELVTDFVELFGEHWDGCWEIEFEDGEITLVTEEEIEPAKTS